MQDFKKLINKDQYQVFLFACPASMPISFAKHPWFVLNKKGKISRWEIMHYKNKVNKNLEYLHIDSRSPFKGFGVFYPIGIFFWRPKLICFIEGDENSKAFESVKYIENSIKEYPYCHKYRFWVPNSNTYAQWVLSQFPEFNVKLSWRFIGKNYK